MFEFICIDKYRSLSDTKVLEEMTSGINCIPFYILSKIFVRHRPPV